MNLRTRVSKAPARVLILAAVCVLVVAAPVFAVSAGLVAPATDVQANGPDETDGANSNVQDGTQDQVGPDETNGANSNVEDAAQNQAGPDETDGANSDVQDGTQNQVGPDETNGANSDVQDGPQNEDPATPAGG